MADTSFVGASATMLAEFDARLEVAESVRRRAQRRAIACVAVAGLHVIFVALLIAAQWMPVDTWSRKPEALMWIPLQPQMAPAPKVNPAKSKELRENGTVNPNIVPRFIRPQTQEENNAIDWGLAIGKSLACGANSYEWLNSKMRAECKHKPWEFVYDRYGNIVLDARPRVPQEEKPRPSDVQAHERNTAPRCPQNVDPNAPCLADIIGGRP